MQQLIAEWYILAGRKLAQSSIPIIVLGRRALGPMSLSLLGWVPLRFSVGRRVSEWLASPAGVDQGGAFLLFFGLTIPLALQSQLGVGYLTVYALGASVPLLIGLLLARTGATAGYRIGTSRTNARLRVAAAVVLLLAGMNDTVIYWWL